MSGRAYTMKEMKGIVDYLKEHKLFAELRGRKMWTDFANSNATNRTWQSLKETFLKRILPDINNPYYKLSVDEIRSFRTGKDETGKPGTFCLEFRSVSDNATSNVNSKETNGQPSTSKDIEDQVENKYDPGESNQCKKVNSNRDSVDTLIIVSEENHETCERTDIEDEENNEKLHKSLRDCISYAEPLTPMMQTIYHDFQTESEGSDSNRKEKNENDEASSKEKESSSSNENNGITNSSTKNKISATDKTNLKSSVVDDKEKSLLAEESPRKKSLRLRKKTNSTISISSNSDSLLDKHLKYEEDTDSNLITNIQNTDVQGGNSPIRVDSCSITDSLPLNQEALYKKDKEIINNSQSILTGNTSKTNDHNTSSESTSNKENKSGNKNKQIVEVVAAETNSELTLANNDSPLSNPCLQSVSLFAESANNFNENCDNSTTKIDKNIADNLSNRVVDKYYKDNVNKKDETNNAVKKKLNLNKEVVCLKSHTDSDSDDITYVNQRADIKQSTSKVLNSLFGKSSGGPVKKRKRWSSHQGTPVKVNNVLRVSSDSSEWTSESDSEYVSPPRSRNRHSRKYMKPQSARISSLEQEGGLFVACGMNIYPLIKDGKVLKNYLTYLPESDTEENESYWKLKYVEERKKTGELKRLLEDAKHKNIVDKAELQDSPILPNNSRKFNGIQNNHKDEEVKGHELVLSQPKEVESKSSETAVKIKYAKANEEIVLEGHWKSIHPILTEVMQVFHKDNHRNMNQEPQHDKEPIIMSGQSTPVINVIEDEETHRKVDVLEKEIFKTIEEFDSLSEAQEDQVTERKKRIRPKKESKLSLNKKQKISEKNLNKSDDEIIVNENKLKPIAAEDVVENSPRKKRRTRIDTETSSKLDTNIDVQSENKADDVTANNEDQKTEDTEILYKFPSPEPEPKKSKSKNTTVKKTKNQLENSKCKEINKLHLLNDSTQGYQESDDSTITIHKKKKYLSISTYQRGRNNTSRYHFRKTIKCFDWDASGESSNSSQSFQTNSHGTSIKTDEYRSDSYQLIMPKAKVHSMERISELSPCPNEINSVCDLKLSPASQKMGDTNSISSNSLQTNTENNSSNVSLPMSPELSIVENISINKDTLQVVDFPEPTINESQQNNNIINCTEKYIISEVDISVPLMGQECKILTSQTDAATDLSEETSLVKNTSDKIVTRSLLAKIDTVKINENTMSDSLDLRLQNLLLESAKKISNQNEKQIKAESDTEVKVKKRNKKRCSTPRKKKENLPKVKIVEPLIEEEQMEFCCSGRKSCPPVISVCVGKNENKKKEKVAVNKKQDNKRKTNKNVIKVKILRPKDKPGKSPQKRRNGSKSSVLTDSGINDTISSGIFKSFNETVDLIHNHSETCLQTNECLTNSVEYVTRSKSLISLSSSIDSRGSYSLNDDKENLRRKSSNISVETFSNDAQDCSSLNDFLASKKNLPDSYDIMNESSLLTEDLSEEQVSPSNWYLLSEEEQTNTLNDIINPKIIPKCGQGSKLTDIFPVTCAVPDLSTITEFSKEADSNTKSFMNTESNTRKEFLKDDDDF